MVAMGTVTTAVPALQRAVAYVDRLRWASFRVTRSAGTWGEMRRERL